jgi:hypothetical protein
MMTGCCKIIVDTTLRQRKADLEESTLRRSTNAMLANRQICSSRELESLVEVSLMRWAAADNFVTVTMMPLNLTGFIAHKHTGCFIQD